MSKVVTSRINEEEYEAFMMIASETGDHPSKLIKQMINKFIIERGAEYRDMNAVRIGQAYIKERDRQSFISQIKYLINAYQNNHLRPKDGWEFLQNACEEAGLDFEALKGK